MNSSIRPRLNPARLRTLSALSPYPHTRISPEFLLETLPIQPALSTDDLLTARLRLVSITPAMLEAEQHDSSALANQLHANVPTCWPPEHWEPAVFTFIRQQYRDAPQTRGWHRYMLLPATESHAAPTLIGCLGAFPYGERGAELGYSVLSPWQCRGYVTEAVTALTDSLICEAGVTHFVAHTFPSLRASIRVLEKCGFTAEDHGEEPGTSRFTRNERQVISGK